MPPLDDEKRLVASCIECDPQAWEAFVRRYTPVVVASIRKTLSLSGRPPDSNDVDSAYQDVFFDLWRDGAKALRRFSWNSSIGTYLWVIARRKALDRMAKRPAESPEAPTATPEEEIADLSPAPQEELARRETRELVVRSVALLPQRDRDALTTYYLEGLPMEMVAEKLSLSVPSAAMVVLRARKKLSKIMGESGKKAL